jgi:hypothetical protein
MSRRIARRDKRWLKPRLEAASRRHDTEGPGEPHMGRLLERFSRLLIIIVLGLGILLALALLVGIVALIVAVFFSGHAR